MHAHHKIKMSVCGFEGPQGIHADPYTKFESLSTSLAPRSVETFMGAAFAVKQLGRTVGF